MPEGVRVKSYPVSVQDVPEPAVDKFEVTESEGIVVLWIE
jgi:hypothetical protein